MLDKAARKAIKKAAIDVLVPLSVAAAYLGYNHTYLQSLAKNGVIAAEWDPAGGGRWFLRAANLRRLHAHLKAGGTLTNSAAPSAPEPTETQDPDALLTLDAVASALHCTIGRAQELVQTGALPAQLTRSPGGDPEWLVRAGDMWAYQQWRDRELPAGRVLPH